jgi:probable phosphoglycerate mutase
MEAHRITLVRHGETAGQSSIRYHGINDVPLNEAGEDQMRRVGRALAQKRFDRVFSSALRRTREAARLIVPSPVALPVAELNEINFGRWEGLTKDEIAERDPELYARWRAEPRRFQFPEGDDRVRFGERVAAGIVRILDEHPSGEWLMVLHRGVIVSALDHFLGPGSCDSLDVPLGSIHVVARNGRGWVAEALDLLPPD